MAPRARYSRRQTQRSRPVSSVNGQHDSPVPTGAPAGDAIPPRLTRSGGANPPPETPVKRRSSSDHNDPPVKRTRSGNASKHSGGASRPPETRVQQRCSSDQNHPPVKRTTSADVSKQTPHDQIVLNACQALDEFLASSVMPPPSDDIDEDLKDDVCMVCHGPGTLTVCWMCIHAVCSDCVTTDVSDWHCASSGLRCTERLQKRLVVELDQDTIARQAKLKARPVRPLKTGAKCSVNRIEYNAGDYVEFDRSQVPGVVNSRAWARSSPDSDVDEDEYRPCFARVKAFRSKASGFPEHTAQAQFFIYPDQTTVSSCATNELLMVSTLFDVPAFGIIGPSKPIHLMSQPSKASSSDDCFVVRYQYDIYKRARRPLLEVASDREEIVIDTASTACRPSPVGIQQGIQRLQLSNAPAQLPCRDEERAEIEQFLKASIRVGGSGSAMYISGLPGTGKTATVNRVIQGLKDDCAIGTFQYVQINALKLQSPVHAYSHLWKAISGKHSSPGRALHQLQEYYNAGSIKKRKGNPIVILLLDEFDYLVEGKTQNVLYNLFGFPTTPKAGLVVIGIANTLDLHERISSRVFSRIGFTRMNFKPYSALQIEQIITARLKDFKEFIDDSAITLCSKSIASKMGDLRRALEVIAIAIEKCLSDGSNKLTINHVSAALKSIADSVPFKFMVAGSFLEGILLCSLVQELKATGRYEANYDAVVRRHARLVAQRAGHRPASTSSIERILECLARQNLIMLCRKRGIARPDIRLVASIDDVKLALSKTALADIPL